MSEDEKKILYGVALAIAVVVAIFIVGYGNSQKKQAFLEKQKGAKTTGRVSRIRQAMKERKPSSSKRSAVPAAAE